MEQQYKTDAEIYAVLEAGDHRPDSAAGQFVERKPALRPLWGTAFHDPGGAAAAAGERLVKIVPYKVPL